MPTQKTKTDEAGSGARPPQWILDEIERNPELLRVVAEVVRAYRVGPVQTKNPRR